MYPRLVAGSSLLDTPGGSSGQFDDVVTTVHRYQAERVQSVTMPTDIDTDILVTVAEDSEIPVTTLWYALTEGHDDTGVPSVRLERAVDEARRRQDVRDRQSKSRSLSARIRNSIIDRRTSNTHI